MKMIFKFLIIIIIIIFNCNNNINAQNNGGEEEIKLTKKIHGNIANILSKISKKNVQNKFIPPKEEKKGEISFNIRR
jgi:hypothetical protein